MMQSLLFIYKDPFLIAAPRMHVSRPAKFPLTTAIMHFSTAVVALVASLQITYAAPSEKIVRESSLRLIKTSEDDPGQWVTEEEKYENFTAKKIGFIDITEIRVNILEPNF